MRGDLVGLGFALPAGRRVYLPFHHRYLGAPVCLPEGALAELAAADNTLKATLKAPGTAFAVDPVTNKVVVSVDSTVTGAKLAAVNAIASEDE